ncbi:OHCU decarboxylase [Enterobacterales bacterium CwR94]|nr:OHCU decarboxylase [Enterobacterales bacterium CwR94]
MLTLAQFNALLAADAINAIAHCVAIPHWQQAVVAARPYGSREELLHGAALLGGAWQLPELTLALSAHPRIGERAQGDSKEAGLSRNEQAGVGESDAALKAALHEGNRAYEARFGRVFLVRAKGRTAQQMLAILQSRLNNSPEQEIETALQALREITQLRLEETLA